MTVKGLVGTLTHGAFAAARHPLGTTARAVGIAKGVAESGLGLVRGSTHVTEAPAPAPGHQEAVREAAERAEEAGQDSEQDSGQDSGRDAVEVPEQAQEQQAQEKRAQEKQAEPEETLAEQWEEDPRGFPPLREPLPAAPQRTPEEMASASVEQFATEPKAASRDSAHGGQPGDREEIDGYVEEAQPDTDAFVGVETPVGTAGAGAGRNPDTAEADLQQPETPGVLDPSVVKEVRSETEVLRKAADTEKE